MKNVTFVFATLFLACTAALAASDFPQADFPSANAGLEAAVNQKVAQNQKGRLKVDVDLSYERLTPTGQQTVHYECSGVIVQYNKDKKSADVAIDQACAAAINSEEVKEMEHLVSLGITMKNLGAYKNPTKGNDGNHFFYVTHDARFATFAQRPLFMVYALPLKNDSEVRAALEDVFSTVKPITAAEASAMLKAMPPAKRTITAR